MRVVGQSQGGGVDPPVVPDAPHSAPNVAVEDDLRAEGGRLRSAPEVHHEEAEPKNAFRVSHCMTCSACTADRRLFIALLFSGAVYGFLSLL